jgi:hypothetical protein
MLKENDLNGVIDITDKLIGYKLLMERISKFDNLNVLPTYTISAAYTQLVKCIDEISKYKENISKLLEIEEKNIDKNNLLLATLKNQTVLLEQQNNSFILLKEKLEPIFINFNKDSLNVNKKQLYNISTKTDLQNVIQNLRKFQYNNDLKQKFEQSIGIITNLM